MDRREFVEQREITEVLRQIKDIKREIQRLVKKATKANLTAEVAQLNELSAQLLPLETTLKGSPDTISRDTLQEFYDAQMWETLNGIRIKIELPNEIKKN